MKARYLVAILAVLVGLLVAADSAQAQVRIGIGIGGGRGGYYPSYGRGYSSFYIGPSYYVPRTMYYPPPVYYPPPITYIQPVTRYEVPRTVASSGPAHVRVLVPDPEAQVWFDGNATKQKGMDRLFHTPDLEPGSTYSYRIRASWMVNNQPMIQEMVVTVSPGQTSTADFRKAVSEAVPSPK